jgi:hypothetical protein
VFCAIITAYAGGKKRERASGVYPELYPIRTISGVEDSTPSLAALRIRSNRKGIPITHGDPQGRNQTPGGVALLFLKEARPDAAAVRSLAEKAGGFSISHDPRSAAGSDSEEENWLELLINGLTFDLRGLAGGGAAELPDLRHSFGLEDAPDAVEAVSLVAGPHLAGGESMMPIVRSQLALALRLAVLPGLVAVAWTPARSAMAVTYFKPLVSAWLEGGAFPALGLTVFTLALDGGLQSEGLAFLIGQELRLEPELTEDGVAATKLAVRLVNALVEHGEVTERLEMTGPDGAPLVLEPSANNTFVRVRAGE